MGVIGLGGFDGGERGQGLSHDGRSSSTSEERMHPRGSPTAMCGLLDFAGKNL
jgi:hypothetical protein